MGGGWNKSGGRGGGEIEKLNNPGGRLFDTQE